MLVCCPKRAKKLWHYTLALFIISVVVRFILADYTKFLIIYPDEFRYYAIASNLASGSGLLIYNVPTSFQKIFYSFFLIPAFFFKDKTMQMQAAALINALIMSSAIFPFYLLAKRLIPYRYKTIAGLMTLFVVMPDMSYTMMYVSEVVFLPLAMWLLLGCHILFNSRGLLKHPRVFAIILGIGFYMGYLCKEIALVFPISCFGLLFLETLWHIRNRDYLKAVIPLKLMDLICAIAAFASLFILFKLTIFSGLGNSYDQTSIGILFEEGRLHLMIHGFIYYIVYVLFACGFLPLVFPLVYYADMSAKQRRFFTLLWLLLLSSAAVIAYTITMREDMGLENPRAHLRYIVYLWLPLMCIFTSLQDTPLPPKKYILWLIPLLASFATAYIFRGVEPGSLIDQTMLKYMFYFGSGILRLRWLLIPLTIVSIFLWVWERRLLYTLFFAVFTFLQLGNNYYCTYVFHLQNHLPDTTISEAERLESLVTSHPDANFLIVAQDLDDTQKLADTWLIYDNVWTVSSDSLKSTQSPAGTDLGKTALSSYIWGQNDCDLKAIDYILVRDDAAVHPDSRQCQEDAAFDSDLYDLYIPENPNWLPAFSD